MPEDGLLPDTLDAEDSVGGTTEEEGENTEVPEEPASPDGITEDGAEIPTNEGEANVKN